MITDGNVKDLMNILDGRINQCISSQLSNVVHIAAAVVTGINSNGLVSVRLISDPLGGGGAFDVPNKSGENVDIGDNVWIGWFGDLTNSFIMLNNGEPGITVATTGAGAHNAIYRGKSLGTAVTEAQWAAIKAGTFEDMYIGDYWTIGGVVYRIAAFDYYYKTGDTSCKTHHITLVPDGNMYTHVMNDTKITTGAYVGSKMYTEGLNEAKTTINSAFGEAHILNHRQYLQNAVTDGYASGGSWYDSTVELMTEQNVYGGKVFGNQLNGTTLPTSHTVDKSQYPLFTFRPDMISNRAWFWLRDVVSASRFARVTNYGIADSGNASSAYGVRPAFSIYQS